ncbi:MAG: WavE lipopolysaccharide synthesis family protein [Halarcobacter sp.]
MKINLSNIGILYQGQITKDTISSIKKTRSNYPDVEIILSTWKSEDIYKDKLTNVNHNVHRQVCNTLEGIKKSTKEFILKLRTDCQLISTQFFSIFEIKLKENKLFKNKINIINQGTIDPSKYPFLFHISDLIMFGRKEDLLDYWNQTNNYKCKTLIIEDVLFNNIGYIDSISINKSFLSEKFISTHFKIFDFKESGINLPARLLDNGFTRYCYSNNKIENIEKFFLQTPTLFNYLYFRYLYIFINKYLFCFFKKNYYKGFLSFFALFLKNIGFDFFDIKKKK